MFNLSLDALAVASAVTVFHDWSPAARSTTQRCGWPPSRRA